MKFLLPTVALSIFAISVMVFIARAAPIQRVDSGRGQNRTIMGLVPVESAIDGPLTDRAVGSGLTLPSSFAGTPPVSAKR